MPKTLFDLCLKMLILCVFNALFPPLGLVNYTVIKIYGVPGSIHATRWRTHHERVNDYSYLTSQIINPYKKIQKMTNNYTT
jgi:hypothetical protein